jgi:hypothetical protein
MVLFLLDLAAAEALRAHDRELVAAAIVVDRIVAAATADIALDHVSITLFRFHECMLIR